MDATNAPSISLHNGKGKVRLLTRDELDGRTTAAKQFDAIARGIASDLGGEDQLTTIQRHLVEAFAGAALQVNDVNARLLLGEDVDLIRHCQAITTLVRVASRLPVDRHKQDITPDPLEYARERERAAAEAS